jgi:hypothetical protein
MKAKVGGSVLTLTPFSFWWAMLFMELLPAALWLTFSRAENTLLRVGWQLIVGVWRQ